MTLVRTQSSHAVKDTKTQIQSHSEGAAQNTGKYTAKENANSLTVHRELKLQASRVQTREAASASTKCLHQERCRYQYTCKIRTEDASCQSHAFPPAPIAALQVMASCCAVLAAPMREA